jgi:sec-independent protein translocase protein TatA
MSALQITASINSLFEGPSLIIILFIILLLFGGSKLPSLARGLGKSVKEFKKATSTDDDDDDEDDEKKSSLKKTGEPSPAPKPTKEKKEE